MTYPTPGEYQEALQFPETALVDPHLRGAEPETNVLGIPRAITGAFAVVFPVSVRGARWALKCFLTDVTDQRRRYRAVGEHLREADLPYTTAFEYQDEGIRVGERPYPLLKMEWLDGVGLNRYVAKHLEDADRLTAMWRRMMADLEEGGIAHGDLQHGNILVDGDRLRLVDYDTMYVPALRGRKSPEVGHRNYQHPDRDEHDFGPYLDRFSALLIDTALQACAHRPELWDRFDSGENMLFRLDDLADPSTSLLFEELRSIDGLRDQAAALERACYLEPELVPPLADVVNGRHSGSSLSDVSVRRGWTRRRRQSRQDDSARFHRDGFERWALPGTAAALVVAAAAGFLAGWTATGLLTFIALAGFALLTSLRYRRVPSVRRRHRLIREDAYFQRLLGGLRDELQQARDRREAFLASQNDRVARRLEELQQQALDERLKYHFVGEIRGFEGMTHKVVVRLKAEGIRTAAHATAERVNAIRKLSPESKARVNLWRSTLAAEYRDHIPKCLSPAEERRLKRHLEKRLGEIDRAITRIEGKIAIQQREHANIKARLATLDTPTPLQYTAYLLHLRDRPSTAHQR